MIPPDGRSQRIARASLVVSPHVRVLRPCGRGARNPTGFVSPSKFRQAADGGDGVRVLVNHADQVTGARCTSGRPLPLISIFEQRTPTNPRGSTLPTMLMAPQRGDALCLPTGAAGAAPVSPGRRQPGGGLRIDFNGEASRHVAASEFCQPNSGDPVHHDPWRDRL